VITAGRRNEPVARWIRRQSDGKTRLVHVGRPWAPLDSFDLIVTTPQYFLPDQQNIYKIILPLHGVTSDRLDKAASVWEAKLAHLPRPYTAVLIGGDSGPFVYTREKGRRLGQLINSLAVSSEGSLLVTGSARTSAAVLEALQQELTVPNTVYRWSEDRAGNPYLGYLALADQLVVSGESMSMLAEAGFTGKPLYIYDPADSGSWWRYAHNYRYKPLTHRLAMQLAPRRMHRDVGNIQRQLVSSGRAVWLGQPFPKGQLPGPPDDSKRAAVRVRALFGEQY
jgi:mitochondrial fission protein ELM1